MPDRRTELGIATIERDAMFDLLPWGVKVYDNGALRLFLRAVTDQHNYFANSYRERIKLQDPWKAGAFEPSQFGESKEVYAEYIDLLQRWRTLSDGQKTYATSLRPQITNSLAARKLEAAILKGLASNVGEETYGGKLRAGIRSLIASAISRHHIRGSHSSVSALGLISGFFELKASELWSRFSISEPGDPGSLRNLGDFAHEPEEYPYWPVSSKYDGPDNEQWPLPSASYNPNVLDDANASITTRILNCSRHRTSPYWYNASINGKNPFGNFRDDVVTNLISGTYVLSGGSEWSRASVSIPATHDTAYVFEALAKGDWANSVTLRVMNNRSGSQDIELSGPQSKIKFKTSYYDLAISVDFSVYPLLYPLSPVTVIGAACIDDGLVGRSPPDYPVTGSVDGTRIISNPNTHFAISPTQLQELLGLVKTLFETIRPITRTPRYETFGPLLKDQVLYAPLLTLNDVWLASPSGRVFKMVPGPAGVEWVRDDGNTPTVVTQYDQHQRNYQQWMITDDGEFYVAVPSGHVIRQGEAVVYARSQAYTGFVYLKNGILSTSVSSPELLLDTIHTDGTDDELLLREEYIFYVENPTDGVEVFMSEDAKSNDSPDARLVFQTSPEDAITVRPSLMDFDKFHVDSHFGTEEEDGFSGANWYYDLLGQPHLQDVRLRSAGIEPHLIEPVPTGNQSRQDGLRYDYPVRFINYHNVVAWRNRVTNEPFVGGYKYDSPGKDAGATLEVPCTPNRQGYGTPISIDEPDLGDGQIEGSQIVSPSAPWEIKPVGEGVTPNNQFGTVVIDSLILTRMVRVAEPVWAYVSITEHDGYALLTVSAQMMLQTGHLIFLPSGPYAGLHRVRTRLSAYTVVLDTAFSANSGPGTVLYRATEAHILNSHTATVNVSRDENRSPAIIRAVKRDSDGSEHLISTTTLSNEFEVAIDVTVEAGTILVLYTSSEFPLRLTVELPDNAPSLDGHAMWQGGARSAPELTLTEGVQHFYEHAEGGIDPHEPIAGNKWWRGGTWRGDGPWVVGDRDELPDLLDGDGSSSSSSQSDGDESSSSSSSASSHSDGDNSSSSSSSSSYVPPSGTPLGSPYCIGYNLCQDYADGMGGSYTTAVRNSPTCGFTPPEP